MSRGNLIQGQASGKLGDTVLMVRNGQQLARVYTKAGARSGEAASESARIQRVKFGGASNEWSLYRYVSTRMFRRGRSKAQSDYNYWVKRNNQLLPYLTKAENALGCKYLMPGVFAEGSLGNLPHVITYLSGTSPALDQLSVNIIGSSITGEVDWGDTVLVFKQALRDAFPNATKVTYLLAYANVVTLEADEQEYFTQAVSYHPVTFDLYKETQGTDDSKTVMEYFDDEVENDDLKQLINSVEGQILDGSKFFFLEATTAAENALLEKVSCMIFATNDSVSDCYTTSVSSASVNPTDGAYVYWAEHRTNSALSRAAASYGYQAGVMRDEVSAWGGEIINVARDYAARLAEINPVAAKAYEQHLERKLAAAKAEESAASASEKA